MSFCKSVFWELESSVLVTQSVETLYLFLVGMSGMCFIHFYIFATGDKSDRDVFLSLNMVILSRSFVTFRLTTVHTDALPASA